MMSLDLDELEKQARRCAAITEIDALDHWIEPQEVLALIAEVRRLRDVICGPAIAAMPQDLIQEMARRQAEGMRNAAWTKE